MLPLPPARWTWGLVFGLTWSLQLQAYSASNVFLNKNSTTSSAKPEKVKFDTVDQVQLQGTFYPSPQDRKGTTVLFLHKIGSHSQKDNWDKLAETLQAAGCAVLSFDFRGHGESVSVAPEFWQQQANQGIRGFNLAKPKGTISYKDFPPAYMPYLVNDIAAAKSFLDRKNNGGDCNTSNLILIGARTARLWEPCGSMPTCAATASPVLLSLPLRWITRPREKM